MRTHNGQSTTSPSATGAGSTPSRRTSATRRRSHSCWSGSGRSCRRSRAWHTWRVCWTTRCYHSRALESFRTTLAPKAFGGYHLHRLTKNDDLEFFIVYSSASSVIGSPGQANYATANALLDGLVADRRAHGLPATGINWGPWAQGGMATSHAARANLSAQGLIPLEPTAALNALDEIIAHGTGAGNRHQSQLAACREGAGRHSPGDSRPRAAECCRGDARRQRVAPATARGTRGGARQFPHRIPAARGTTVS